MGFGCYKLRPGATVKRVRREPMGRLTQWSPKEMISGCDYSGSDGTREKQTHVISVRRSHRQGTVQRPEQNSRGFLRDGHISPSISWSDLYPPVKAVITRHIFSCIPVRGQIPCKLTLKLIFFQRHSVGWELNSL